MVEILSGKRRPQRSALDYSICFCFIIFLLLLILLIDAYEYITVPGAHHARKHIRTGVNLVGDKIHTGVESMTGLELMTKAEKEEMRREVEKAMEVVQKEHDAVEEKIVLEEKVLELEKEDNKPDTQDSPVQEIEVEEEKREEIVEAIVEKELGLENWCGSCKWLKMGFTCDQRVAYMMQQYQIPMVAAKEANIEHCSNAV